MGTRTDVNQECDAAQNELAATRRRIEEKARALKDRMSARELARPLIDPIRERLGGSGEKILDTFREHPVPLGLVGLGLGWMMIRDARGARPGPERSGPSLSDKVSDKARDVKESVEGAAESVQEKAHEIKESISRSASRVAGAGRSGAEGVRNWFRNTLEENPWLLALGAAAAGAALGLSLPLTEWEKENAGELGERLAGAAMDRSREAIEGAPEAPPAPAPTAGAPPMPES